MKLILTILIFFSLSSFGAVATYYVAGSGSDANNGRTPATPFLTIAKINTIAFLPGDQVLFNRGDSWHECLKIGRNGTAGFPILFGAYGSGADPVITGFSNVTSWTNLGSNIWESTTPISTLPYTNMVAVNGVAVAMGNIGTLTYQSHNGTISLTSSSLTGSPNWTGAELAFFATTYGVQRDVITSQSGGTVSYAKIGTDVGIQADGQQFTIQNDPRTLNLQNEWYYNPSTKKIQMYSVGTPSGVQVSTLDSLIYINGHSWLTFDNITLKGANIAMVNMDIAQHITIQNCDLDLSGRDGIFAKNNVPAGFVTVENCTINHCYNNGINMYYAAYVSSVIRGNTVHNCGMTPFMGNNGKTLTGGTSYSGIVCMGPSGLIELNRVDSVGYNGIQYYGNNTLVQNNYATNFCSKLHDGGGFYIWDAYGDQSQGQAPTLTNVRVLNNISGNCPTDMAFYFDDNTNGVHAEGNTGFYCYVGLYSHNNWNMNFRVNTMYVNSYAQYNMINNNVNITMHNDTLKNNIFFSKGATERAAYFYRLEQVNAGWPGSDSNYYARPISDNTTIDTYYNGVNAFKTLAQLKTILASPNPEEQHSNKSPKAVTSTDSLRFEYNPTNASVVVNLPKNFIDVRNVSYNGTITLAPYSSAALIQNGPVIGASNIPPTASAGIDQTITLPTSSVTVNGSGADVDGSIASYNWTQISGTSATITSPSSASTTITGLTAGTRIFRLTVTDNQGATGFDDITINVNPAANVPPTANAGPDQSITLPTSSVTLSGSGTDTDGSIVSYSWTKTSGIGSTILSPNSATTTVTGLSTGTYIFRVTVTDNNGATGFDEVTISVNAANIPPSANAGPDKNINLPTNFTSFAGSGTDADGSVVSYVWTKTSGSGGTITNPNSASTTITGLGPGTHIYRLTVTDNIGATGFDEVTVTVNAPSNIPPAADAGPDKNITLPVNSTSFIGSGTDADGTVVSFAWSQLSGPNTATIISPFSSSTSVAGLIQGTYQFQLTVTDNQGATGTDIVIVTVNASVFTPPSAHAGADQIIKLPVSSTIVDGSASTDNDGTITVYSWAIVSGSGTITNPNSATTTVTGLTADVTLRLTVTDNDGLTDFDDIDITVNPANIDPTAFAGTDKNITLPASSTTLIGSGSDVDGSIVSYLWTKTAGPGTYSITTPNNSTTSIFGLTQGTYTFTLTVTDNDGGTNSDDVDIVVNPPVPPNLIQNFIITKKGIIYKSQ